MKNILFLCISLIFLNTVSGQNHREFNRDANKAFKESDYINATLYSIKSLQIKNNFKTAVKLFERSISLANTDNLSKINRLVDQAVPYKDEQSAIQMKEIYTTYRRLNQIQNELINFPKKVKLKNKNIITENTYDFTNQINNTKNLLKKYNNITAENFYNEADGILSQSASPTNGEYRKAYRLYVKSDSYVDNYNDVKELIEKTLELGKVKIAITKKNYTNNNFNRLHDQIRDKIFERRFTKNITSTLINEVPINLQDSDPGYIKSLVQSASEDRIIDEIFEIVYIDFRINNIRVINSTPFSNSVQVKERVNDSTTTSVTKTAVGTLYELYGMAELVTNLTISDALYGNVLFDEKIPQNYEYRKSYINYKGDIRALPKGYSRYTTIRPVDPNLKTQVEQKVLSRISEIINSRYEN
tara:strand:+ start:4490 stop:5734 length:1245 start_codon:yes stop_codon:yes gene_type:complete